MIRKLKQILGNRFEQDYTIVHTILEAVLPQIKENGWQYKDIKTQTYHPTSHMRLNMSELEDKICDHYFEYTKEVYEASAPKLLQIHKSWYAVLRDFTQSYLMREDQEKVRKRIIHDFGKFFDEEYH
jgi:hypothetical protein